MLAKSWVGKEAVHEFLENILNQETESETLRWEKMAFEADYIDLEPISARSPGRNLRF